MNTATIQNTILSLSPREENIILDISADIFLLGNKTITESILLAERYYLEIVINKLEFSLPMWLKEQS